MSAARIREARILLVEDNASLRRGIARALRTSWSRVDDLETGDAAVERLGDRGVEPYDAIVTDLRLPGADGMAVLRAARTRDARSAVLLMTAHGTIETAVQAMQLGAFDFVQKPFELEELEVRVERAVEHARLVDEVATLREHQASPLGGEGIVGESPELQAAMDLARRVAPTRSTILVTGETGTGKELIAGRVHACSQRSAGPFIKVNCAALPETLLESELFGHERGAFTGADRLRIGRFEQADGGTLFLDEVGDMSAATQAKLLRVLQDGEFQRLGGTRPLRSDVRVVAATNRDLEKAIAQNAFREDLYFRLNVIRVHLPPLRERPADVEALARHFLDVFGRELARPRAGFHAEAMARLRAHDWPGNVRELRNVIERSVLLSDGDRIEAEDIDVGVGRRAAARGGAASPIQPGGSLALAGLERAAVEEALRRSGFVQKEAAALLEVSRRKLNYMIQRMGITHPSWRRNRGPAAASGAAAGAEPEAPGTHGAHAPDGDAGEAAGASSGGSAVRGAGEVEPG